MAAAAASLVAGFCLAAGMAHGLEILETMEAVVATSPTEFSTSTVEVPQLGSLRRKFTGLPDSCEVQVAVHFSSVNPADRSTPGPFPQVMGSDLAGTVVAVEPACRRLAVGDRVWADIGAAVHFGAGAAKGKENGAYAQVAVALESQLGRLPNNASLKTAAALPKVALTSLKALTWYGGAPYTATNGSVLILGGSGGCGTVGIQLAKALGATRVVTTTSAPNFAYVRDLGADRVIDYHAENWWDVLLDDEFDAIYDTIGQKGTGDRAMPKLRRGGFYVTIMGALPANPRSDVSSSMFINSDTNLDNFRLLDQLQAFAEGGHLRMPDIKTYPLSDLKSAFAESAAGHVRGKLVVEVPPAVAALSTSEKKELRL